MLTVETRKSLLGTLNGVLCRTLALRRPYLLQPELGARGRDPLWGHFYASTGLCGQRKSRVVCAFGT